jgi:hypothetical protein
MERRRAGWCPIAPRYRLDSQSIFLPISRSVFIARECCRTPIDTCRPFQEEPVKHSLRAAQVRETGVKIVRLSFMWSLLRRMLAGDRGPAQTEWDNDVPPFPVLIGEVARAEATLTFQAKRRHRGLAA